MAIDNFFDAETPHGRQTPFAELDYYFFQGMACFLKRKAALAGPSQVGPQQLTRMKFKMSNAVIAADTWETSL